MVVPSFLRWSESPITFDQRDHPSHIARPGCYPLVVDPIIRKKRLTKVLMEEGSGLNILYVDTLDAMRIPWSELRLAGSPFHEAIPGVQAYPLGQIDLSVTFGKQANFRSEVLTIEVDFLGSYHAILGRPCYAKFMAIPNYTYLKLKMSGPNGIITVESTYEHAYDCDVERIEYAEALVEAKTLIVNVDQLGSVAPDSKRRAGTFEPVEAVKLVPVDPACSNGRALRISAALDSK